MAPLGEAALYLVAHVAFRLRNVHSVNWHRLGVAALLAALVPLGVQLPALATLAILAGVLAALIVFETVRFAEARDGVRHEFEEEAAAT